MKTKGAVGLTLPEIEQAKALSGQGRSVRAIARELHRSPHAIKRVLAKPEVIAEVQTIRRNLADSFEGLAERMVGSITDADILELDAYKRTLSGAIATDKAQLLKGQPTAIVGLEVLQDLAAVIREQDNKESEEYAARWQAEHTITLPPAEPEQPANPASPVSVPESAPVPNAANPASSPTVRYYTPTPIEDSVDESPLMHGLKHSR